VLKLQFTGKTYDLHFLLADVHAESPLGDDEAHIFGKKDGLFALFPLGKGLFRLVADNPPDRFRSQKKPTLQGWQELVNTRSSVPAGLFDLGWSTNFRVNSRMVQNLQRGRAFLMGDATHIHSPALAQGMNTGIQDACNLGWKLALVQKSLAQPTLLSSFEAERMPVERRILGMTDFHAKHDHCREADQSVPAQPPSTCIERIWGVPVDRYQNCQRDSHRLSPQSYRRRPSAPPRTTRR
jgi:3-(3-hydroxy-phenyl)propionate hydroxylase